MKNIFLLLISCILLLGCSEDSTTPEEQDDFSGNSGTFVDERDGNEYNWVKIGEQIWMAENLEYLPYTYFTREEQPLTAAYFVYDYFGSSIEEAKATENFDKYGVLYNYMATLDASPSGWHIPSDDEWEELAEYLNAQNGGFDKFEDTGDESGLVDDWTGIGKFLKSDSGWEDDKDGTNVYGFSAFPAGSYVPDNNHDFETAGYQTIFWSSTEVNNGVFVKGLDKTDNFYTWSDGKGGSGCSIRCIKD